MTRPAAIAIATPRIRLTYAHFNRALHATAFRLAECKIEPGQTVALCIRNAALHCVLIAALNRMGAVPFSLYRSASAEEDISVPENLRINHVLVEQPYKGGMPPQALGVDLEWLKIDGKSTGEWVGAGLRDRDATSHIFAASATTEPTKAVGLSTRQIEARLLKRSIGIFAAGRTGRTMSLFGLRTAIGFQTIFENFWAGGTIFTGWPERTIPQFIARNGIERLEASPAQYQAILRASDPAKSDLSALRFAVIGGGMTTKPLIAAIRTKLCRALIGQYGATELGMVSFGPARAQEGGLAVGHLVPWMQAQVVDADGRVLPAGTEGYLRFRCEEMATTYLDDPQAAAKHFKDGWFYPGHIGTIAAERALSLSGKSPELIGAGGVKRGPGTVENVVMSHEGVVECAAFGVPDARGAEQIWAAIVVNRPIDMQKLRQHCKAKLGAKAPRHFLTLDALPRSGTGQILRTVLSELAAKSAKPAAKRSRKS